jgi:hypothetical protein
MEPHLSAQESRPLRLFRVTTRSVFTGELRHFEITAVDSYHAACQAKQVAKHDTLVRICFA